VRRTPTAVAFLMLLAACSSGGTTVRTGESEGVESAAPTETLQELSVIGNGRASQAASATGASTVVATTIGLNLVDAEGAVTPLGSEIGAPASAVTVSPDGRYAIVEGWDRTEVWSVDTAPTLVAGFDVPTRAVFTADSATLVTSSGSEVSAGAVTEAPQAVINAPEATELGTATMTPDGSVIAVPVTGDSADLIIYTAAGGTIFADTFVEPERKVARAEFGDRADRLVLEVTSGDPFEGQLAAWDALTQQIVWETAAGEFIPGSVWDVGADGRVLTADGSVLRLIGLAGTVDGEWQLGDTRSVTAIAATATGYAVALSDNTLLLTGAGGDPSGPSVSTGRRIVDLERLAGADGAITVDEAGDVRAWGADGALLNEITAFRAGAVNDVAISADGSSVAAASTAGMVVITDMTGSAPRALDHPEGNVDSVDFSPDGSRVVTGVGQRLSDIAFDDTVSLWNLADGVRAAQFGGEGEDVNGCANFRNTVAYSPNGDLFAASSHDFTVALHRADTGEIVTTLPAHVSTVLDLEFSPTGDRLVTSSDDGAVRIWNVETTEMITEFIGPPGGYWSVAFMPDGERLVVGDLTGALRLISVADGAELIAFQGTTSRTGRPSLSPDGSLLAAPADGNAVGIWSTQTGQLVTTADGHQMPVTSTAFSSDGTILVTGSGDTTVRTWSV
jgi:WD40 repeat protein